MKKLLIILLALSSCAPKGAYMYVIQEKKPSGTPGMCEYWMNRPGKFPFKNFPQYSYVIDSCHIYEEGDDWYWLQHHGNN